MAQCYYKDSGLICEHGDTEANYRAADWYDSGVHATCNVAYTFPPDSRAHFYIPGMGTIIDNRDLAGEARPMHPLFKALINELGVDWETVEDKIEAAGGLRQLVDRMDIDRLARRIKKLFLAGDLTTTQVQKIKKVFGHLTSELD